MGAPPHGISLSYHRGGGGIDRQKKEPGGEVWGGGEAPYPLYSPLQPIRTQTGYYDPAGEGSGVRQRLINRRETMGFRRHNLPYHVIINVKMREFIKISGFILIIIGTAGLLLNEFVWEPSSSRTIILAVVNFVGLVNLAFAHFGMRQSKTD